MSEKDKTVKYCEKGHRLDPSWKMCPYCGQPAQSPSTDLKKTMREEVPPELKKTVREDAGMEDVKEPAEDLKKTKILRGRAPEIPALAWLVALDGSARATVYQLIKKKSIVGKLPDCDVCLDDEYISGRQASFNFEKGKYFVTDLDSANGTFVNNKRVTKKGLEDGDKLRLGETNYVFKYYVW